MGTPIIGSTTRMTTVAAMIALEYTSPKESIQRFIFGLLACACGEGTVGSGLKQMPMTQHVATQYMLSVSAVLLIHVVRLEPVVFVPVCWVGQNEGFSVPFHWRIMKYSST